MHEPQLTPTGAPCANWQPLADTDAAAATTFRAHGYELLGKLRTGGQATAVYVARTVAQPAGQLVAIKVFDRLLAPDEWIRFDREAHLSQDIHSPFVAHTVAAIDTGAQLAIVQGLAELHGHNIVHRDIKPTNILVGSCPVIIDLGLAKVVAAHPAQGATRLMASHNYASPEQLGGRELTTASDIYSWALTVVEVTTGKKAFPGITTSLTHPPDLRGVPGPLLTPLRLALSRAPEDRPDDDGAHDPASPADGPTDGPTSARPPATTRVLAEPLNPAAPDDLPTVVLAPPIGGSFLAREFAAWREVARFGARYGWRKTPRHILAGLGESTPRFAIVLLAAFALSIPAAIIVRIIGASL